jgi:hypothetical protein
MLPIEEGEPYTVQSEKTSENFRHFRKLQRSHAWKTLQALMSLKRYILKNKASQLNCQEAL